MSLLTMVEDQQLSSCHLGALLGARLEGVAHNALLGRIHSLLHKLVVDALMHKGARPCRAALACMVESGELRMQPFGMLTLQCCVMGLSLQGKALAGLPRPRAYRG